MTKYKCPGCTYESPFKDHVKRHMNNTNRCSVDVNLTIVELPSTVVCEKCNKDFDNEIAKVKHMKKCNELAKENKILKQKIKDLESKMGSTTNSGTTNTNIGTQTNIGSVNSTHITINLTPYNDPNMEGMLPYIEAALRKTFLSVPNLIESIHFNKKYPENHNICITNRRTNDAKVFDGRRWKTIDKGILLTEMLDTVEREITSHAEEKGDVKFIKEYDSAKRRGKDSDKELKTIIHNVLFDNNGMVNTKITEVQKPKKVGKVSLEDDQDEDEDLEEDQDDLTPLPKDEFEELNKKLNDGPDFESDTDSESDQETGPKSSKIPNIDRVMPRPTFEY